MHIILFLLYSCKTKHTKGLITEVAVIYKTFLISNKYNQKINQIIKKSLL